MIGTSLFAHYKNNYLLWKQYQKLPPTFRQPSRYFPSETYLKYHKNSDFGGRKVLNFGCGKSVYAAPNVFNVDIVASQGVIVRDPSRSLSQFGQDFDLIIANHVMEHVPDWFEVFKEMASILKPGGRLEIYVPPILSDSAFSFRDHINRIGIRSFDCVGPQANAGSNLFVGAEIKETQDLRKIALVGHFKRPCLKWWVLLAWPSLTHWITTHLWNTVSEEGFLFEKLP